jgi:hypothetical protein
MGTVITGQSLLGIGSGLYGMRRQSAALRGGTVSFVFDHVKFLMISINVLAAFAIVAAGFRMKIYRAAHPEGNPPGNQYLVLPGIFLFLLGLVILGMSLHR